MKQSLRIKRGSEADALYYVYEVDLPSGSTILDALEYIRTGSIPDLMYRHSCHHGSCGTCTVRINGKECLACLTKLEDFAGTIPTIEPLAAFTVEKDLVVDPGAMFRLMPKDATKLRESEWSGGSINREPIPASGQARPGGIDHFVRFEDCIECGACVSVCPVTRTTWTDESINTNAFVGPAVLAAMHREIENCPGRKQEMLALAGKPNGVSACEKHFECSRVCPRMVYPGKHIEQLRKLISFSG